MSRRAARVAALLHSDAWRDFIQSACRSARGWFVDVMSETIERRWRPRLALGGLSQMRFMFIVKSAHSGPPAPELLEAMHKLANRALKAGRMLDNGGPIPPGTGPHGRIANRAAQWHDQP